MNRPNLLIVNPDQWRADVVGHLGNPAVQTPVLDRWVETEAVSFRHAYCQNPVCTPSRCSFLTGWYPHVRGHRTMYHMLHPERGEPNLLKVLKDHGYFVWWGGKNDLVPAQDGYAAHCDVRYRASAEDLARWGYANRPGNHAGDLAWRGAPDGDNFFSFFKGPLDTGGQDLYCDDDWQMVLGAIDFIRNYRGDQPFCLFLPLQYPHPPYCVEEPWYSLTDRSLLPPRIPAPLDWTGKPSILRPLAEGQRTAGWTEERWAELRACYYGMVSRVDHQFGRLLEALRERQIYEQTAVFLFSDHGDFTGDYGIVEKTQNTFEDCLTRVPLAVKPPAHLPTQPGIREALVELIDFPATVYAMTGIDPGYDHFGRSLLPLLAGDTDEHRDAVFCEGGRRLGELQAAERESLSGHFEEYSQGLYWPRLRLQVTDEHHPAHGKGVMCRTREFKYVLRLYEEDELYDLRQDPHELHNRIADPACAGILAQLRQRLARWFLETADVVPRETDRRW